MLRNDWTRCFGVGVKYTLMWIELGDTWLGLLHCTLASKLGKRQRSLRRGHGHCAVA